jgi:hypothetical protein
MSAAESIEEHLERLELILPAREERRASSGVRRVRVVVRTDGLTLSDLPAFTVFG